MEVSNEALVESRAFINGEWISSKNQFEVNNPSSGNVESSISDLGREGAVKAINAAKAARAEWQAKTPKHRSKGPCCTDPVWFDTEVFSYFRML